MPGRGERSRILTLDGGLNVVDPPLEIRDNQLTICDNFWYIENSLQLRPGFQTLVEIDPGDVEFDGDELYILGNPFNTHEHFVSKTDWARLWMVSYTGADSNPITVTDVPRWVQYVNGTTYIGFRGAQAVRTIDSAGNLGATLASSSGSNVVAWHKQRLFTDVHTVPGRIAFSKATDPTIWASPDGGTIDVDVSSNEPIFGLASLGDLLIVFKMNSTWALYASGDPVNWSVRRIHSTVGCVPSYGATPYYQYNNELYFISRDGVFRTNGSSFQNISQAIWLSGDPLYVFTGNRGSYRITRWGNNLIVAGNRGTQQFGAFGYNYVYNLLNGAWTRWTFKGNTDGFYDIYGMPPSYLGTDNFLATYGGRSYISSSENIYSYEAFLSQFGENRFLDEVSTVYNGHFRTKQFTGSPDEYLRLKWLGLEMSMKYTQNQPSFSYIMDDVQTDAVNLGTFGPKSTHKGYKLFGPGRCRSVALDCVAPSGAPWEFNRANLHFALKVPLISSGAP